MSGKFCFDRVFFPFGWIFSLELRSEWTEFYVSRKKGESIGVSRAKKGAKIGEGGGEFDRVGEKRAHGKSTRPGIDSYGLCNLRESLA